MLKAVCFSVLCLLKHLYKASLGNMGPSSLGLKYCERLGIPGKRSLTHLITKVLLTTLILIYPGHPPQILPELSKTKKGYFSHAQIQIIFVNTPDKQKKNGKDTNYKEVMEICWNFVSINYSQSGSLMESLPSASARPKWHLTITEKERIWKGNNISSQICMDATNGT